MSARPRHRRGRSIHVAQGEFCISRQEEDTIGAVLGSCVAACLWDPLARVGGMNHIRLPEDGPVPARGPSVAINAMELLINGLLHAGADKGRLRAKLFGGATMVAGLGDIGRRNGEVAATFLHNEGIPCVSSSLGGDQGRKVQFWPTTGRARQMMLGRARTMKKKKNGTLLHPGASNVELF